MEYLDIINPSSDLVIGNAPKNEIYSKKLPHRIVHIIVYRSNGKIVLQKRSHLVRKYPDMWATGACGHVSSGESYEVAASKELQEELGISSSLHFIDKIHYDSEQGMVKVIALYETTSDEKFTLEDKVEETREFTLNEMKKLPKEKLHPELYFLIQQGYFKDS